MAKQTLWILEIRYIILLWENDFLLITILKSMSQNWEVNTADDLQGRRPQ